VLRRTGRADVRRRVRRLQSHLLRGERRPGRCAERRGRGTGRRRTRDRKPLRSDGRERSSRGGAPRRRDRPPRRERRRHHQGNRRTGRRARTRDLPGRIAGAVRRRRRRRRARPRAGGQARALRSPRRHDHGRGLGSRPGGSAGRLRNRGGRVPSGRGGAVERLDGWLGGVLHEQSRAHQAVLHGPRTEHRARTPRTSGERPLPLRRRNGHSGRSHERRRGGHRRRERARRPRRRRRRLVRVLRREGRPLGAGERPGEDRPARPSQPLRLARNDRGRGHGGVHRHAGRARSERRSGHPRTSGPGPGSHIAATSSTGAATRGPPRPT
jgi:hypothetical protein